MLNNKAMHDEHVQPDFHKENFVKKENSIRDAHTLHSEEIVLGNHETHKTKIRVRHITKISRFSTQSKLCHNAGEIMLNREKMYVKIKHKTIQQQDGSIN